MNRKDILNILTTKNFVILFSPSSSILNLINDLIYKYPNLKNSLIKIKETLNNHVLKLCICHNKLIDSLKIYVINYVFHLQPNYKKFIKDLKDTEIYSSTDYEKLEHLVDFMKNLNEFKYKEWSKIQMYSKFKNQIDYEKLLFYLKDEYSKHKNNSNEITECEKIENDIIKDLIKKNHDLNLPLTNLYKTVNKYIKDICNDYENIATDLCDNFINEKPTFIGFKKYIIWLESFGLIKNYDKNLTDKLILNDINELNIEKENKILKENESEKNLKRKNFFIKLIEKVKKIFKKQ